MTTDRFCLEPQSLELLELLRRRDAALGAAKTAEEKREVFQKFDLNARPTKVPLRRVVDVAVDAGTHVIPCRLYHPNPDAIAPCLLWFHGGGHYSGDLESHDRECRIMASSTGCAVLNVAYRLAPEYQFPAALEDAMTAVLWVGENGEAQLLESDKVFVGGASAGGNLAAAASMELAAQSRPRIAHQFLVYPTVDATLDHETYQTYATGYSYTAQKRRWSREQYVPSGSDFRDPRISPLFGEDFGVLPPTTIISAELDPLRGEAEAYVQRLVTAGVPTNYTCYAGVMHGFFSQSGRLEQGRAALRRLCALLSVARDERNLVAPHLVQRGVAPLKT